ncbi:hypothetical protein, partial [Acetobacter fabarum]|uniref:hypothetical protein n=1 Tax=Acetobacter fabarum TaxID=483199 RepID=UPI001C54C418
QPSKPLFNIKETRLRHEPLLQSSHERENHRERPKTRGFFEPSSFYKADMTEDNAGALHSLTL